EHESLFKRMKHWKKILTLLFLAGTVIYLDARKLGRFIFYNFSDITDYKIFSSRALKKSANPFLFPKAAAPDIPATADLKYNHYNSLESLLEENNTVAFIIIKDDSIQYEQYFNNYDATSIVASFSMAKSVTSLLTGIAIQEGYIQSEHDKVITYIPELEKNGFGNTTIKHLLQMTSTLDFNESYFNPFGEAASFYYG